jgi:hypothetical protein
MKIRSIVQAEGEPKLLCQKVGCNNVAVEVTLSDGDTFYLCAVHLKAVRYTLDQIENAKGYYLQNLLIELSTPDKATEE